MFIVSFWLNFSLGHTLEFVFLLLFYLISGSYCQTPIGIDCLFSQGSNFNCRQYCREYFKAQPQLAWYNITSKKCEPLKSCILPIHYNDYQTNQCYLDITKKKKMPSQYPKTLIQKVMEPTYGQGICVNGMGISAYKYGDLQCQCYFMWENSKTYDMYGVPFYCDRVVQSQKWNGYFFRDLIKDKNGTITMYGPYNPRQMEFIYKQLKQKQRQQTLYFIEKYREAALTTINKSLPQEPWIRQEQIKWVVIISIFIYLLFGVSYLRFESLIVKVNKKQMIRRVKSIIEDSNAFQGNI